MVSVECLLQFYYTLEEQLSFLWHTLKRKRDMLSVWVNFISSEKFISSLTLSQNKTFVCLHAFPSLSWNSPHVLQAHTAVQKPQLFRVNSWELMVEESRAIGSIATYALKIMFDSY